MSARPWFKFYRSDWLGNPRLRGCSAAARALWVDVLAMTEEDGYVRCSTAAFDAVCGMGSTPLLLELENAGVLHRGTDGLILVRHVAKDYHHKLDGSLGGIPRHRKAKGLNPKSSKGVQPRSGSGSSSGSLEVATGERKGVHHKNLVQHWTDVFARTRGAAYTWANKGDLKAVSSMLSLPGSSQEEVARRMDSMLESPDAWIAQRASPRLLLSQWDQFSVHVVPVTKLQRDMLDLQALANNGTHRDAR